ncbi:tetratricopeptide repeat protein [Pedobacter flavus]|uniref:Tetratricopeptide repeat protein n=1 Tax=Pedobacter flavus TaxID=3113906 RepID=A0ABU7H3Z9_9SPHI|nr:tetratricopeptide repeat protein [Pedobacter sp. VNH31]MEE1885316.1 tetratricopeptide repeat protein [Pedobacter sp. VNH31]
MLKKLLLSFLFFTFISFQSKAHFDFNANCKSAFEAIFDLRLNDAKAIVAKEKRLNPNNGITILLDNYIDYFTILTSDSKSDFDRLKGLKTGRLEALEGMDKNSPYYLFAQAEVNLQWGMLKSRFQEYFSSGLDIKRANTLLTTNAKKFPQFLPNRKSLGLINVIFGAIPPNLKGVFSTIGIRGDVNVGIQTLEALMKTMPNSEYQFFTDELVFFLCYINTELVSNKAHYNKLMSYIEYLNKNSLLKSYLQGYVSAKNGQNDKAIDYLLKMPKGDEYVNYPSANYILGNAKLQRGDNDANLYLSDYIESYRGQNYIKDAYLKLSYYYLIRGDVNRYKAYLKMVLDKGYTVDEKDKQALREAKDVAPDLDLLKARLYFDGGYYNKALMQLNNKPFKELKVIRDHIELYYRLGRIYDEVAKDSLAIVNYKKSIQIGSETTYYYAANAALFLGAIYEKNKDFAKAAYYYKQAVDMKNHEYEKSIEGKAKLALKRIGY